MYNSIYLGTDNELEYGRKMFMVENCVIFYFYLKFILFRILTNVHARIQWFLLFFFIGGWGPSQETTEVSLLPSVRDHAIRSADSKFLSHDIVYKN